MRADVFTVEERAAVMRAVKSRGTTPELAVRAAACDLGYRRRYRLHGAGLPGKPDLVFPALRKVVFVHGCFWHGHDCKRGARAPKDNAGYWRDKIARNRARDERALAALAASGWRPLVIWECETRDRDKLLEGLEVFLRKAITPRCGTVPRRQRAHRARK